MKRTMTRDTLLALDPWVFIEATEVGPLGYRVTRPGPGFRRLAEVVAEHGWERAERVSDVRRLLGGAS